MSVEQSYDEQKQQVVDVREYDQSHRLRRILNTWDRVEQSGDQALVSMVDGEITQDAKNILQLHAVQRFIRESYNMLLEYHHDLDDGERNEYWFGEEGNPIGRIEMEHTEDVVFHGIADVMYADWFYEEVWDDQTNTRHGPNQSETQRQQHTVPEEVSWNAYLLLKEFLHEEKDMDLSFEKGGLERDHL